MDLTASSMPCQAGDQNSGQNGSEEPPAPNSIGGSLYKSSQSLKVVGAVVDTLYHNYQIDPEVLESWRGFFDEWKEAAQASEERLYRVEHSPFFMAAKGRGHYEYVLTSPGVGELMVNYHKKFAGARVKLYSQYLAGFADFDQVAEAALELAAFFFGREAVVSTKVSELHVAVDFVGFVPRVADLQVRRFTCPASPHIEEADSRYDVIESMRWGKHGSPVSAVLYNKSKEIREQSTHKAYLLDGYTERGWSEADGDVYRLEFRYSREWLREHSVNGPSDVDVSALLTAGMAWLQLRDQVLTDSNNRRWPVAAVWQEIESQGVALLGEVWRQYRRDYIPHVTVDQLAAQVAGCMACIGALADCTDQGDLFTVALALAEQRQQRQGVNFADMVAERRDRYMLPLAG